MGVLPAVTAQALPHLSDDALAITSSLAEQLNNQVSFDRANTYTNIGGGTDCRLSPFEGVSWAVRPKPARSSLARAH